MYTKSAAILALGAMFMAVLILLAVECFTEMRKKMGICLCILAIGVDIFFCTLAYNQVPASHELTEVTAIVVAKEYQEESSSLVPIRMGKITTYTRRHSPEEFLVTLTYQGITDIIDNQDLYNEVNEGDSLNVYLRTAYDKNQQILHQELLLQPE